MIASRVARQMIIDKSLVAWFVMTCNTSKILKTESRLLHSKRHSAGKMATAQNPGAMYWFNEGVSVP